MIGDLLKSDHHRFGERSIEIYNEWRRDSRMKDRRRVVVAEFAASI